MKMYDFSGFEYGWETREYYGKSLMEIYKKISRELSVQGRITITLFENFDQFKDVEINGYGKKSAAGRIIISSLYSGCDRIISKNGRTIYKG